MWAYATFFKHKIGFYKVSRTVWVRQMYSLLLNVFVLSHEWGVIFLYTNFILLEQAGSEVAEMCLLHLVTHLKKKKKKKSDSWMGTDAALWESNWFRWVLWVKKKERLFSTKTLRVSPKQNTKPLPGQSDRWKTKMLLTRKVSAVRISAISFTEMVSDHLVKSLHACLHS